jgi:hypothetical protein
MLPIVRVAHHQDIKKNAEAIAETVQRHLQHLNTENLEEGIGIADLEVKATIDDSNLDLQIHTNSVLDKEKLLTLIRGELQNLQIESVAKVRIHCWRNDEEFDQTTTEELNAPTPLWTEQFMLEPSQLSKYQNLDLDLSEWRSPEAKIPEAKIPEAKIPETRSAEPQLSKHSVLQQAIAQIAETSDHAKKHLVANDLPPIEELELAQNRSAPVNPNIPKGIPQDINTSISALKMASEEQHQAEIDNNYWQLLLVGGSIVLLGLGIGAMIRATTLKNLINKTPAPASDAYLLKAPNNSTNSTTNNPVNEKASTAQTPTPSDPLAIATSPYGSSVNSSIKPSPYNGLATPTPNVSEVPISSSPLPSSSQTVTLEKFNLIQKGMTIEQVEKILGLSGKIIAETNSIDTVGQVYSWKNSDGSNAIVEFKDGQVVAKAQAGL